MRVTLLIAAVLVLAACGKKDQAATDQNVEQGMTADSIVSNDVTAIDAVTGDAANMAADVDMNFGNLEPGSDAASNGSGPSKPASSHSPAAKSPTARTAAPVETNTVSNTASNAE